MSKGKIVVAMSGGVDSSVAAALLHAEGYDVVGVTMRLWTLTDESLPGPFRSCCSVEDVDDARQVCQTLGVPHYSLNFEREFQAYVVDYFCSEYERGRTPNPCLACNQDLKFHFLLERANALGIERLATGHYARTLYRDGAHRLVKAADARKDQSYVLFMLGQEALSRVQFPLGGLTKAETRAIAGELCLPTAEKADSQDICFIPSGDYRAFVEERVRCEPGEMVHVDGRVLGEHRGLTNYTVGQRHGLGIAAGERVYVVALDVGENRLIVGPEQALYAVALDAELVSFVSGEVPSAGTEVSVKVRSHAPEVPAMMFPYEGRRARVRFAEPQRAITPGQAVVFYDGEEVLGGGLIASTERLLG